MSIPPITTRPDSALVRSVLEAGGSRGASHEDFVEAGLARDYIRTLRQLVDEEGLQLRMDFTTGQPRWVVVADAHRGLRAA